MAVAVVLPGIAFVVHASNAPQVKHGVMRATGVLVSGRVVTAMLARPRMRCSVQANAGGVPDRAP